MKFWKYRWNQKGTHIHVNVFVAEDKEQTYKNCGKLVMSPFEWWDFRTVLEGSGGVKFEEGESGEEDM